MAQLLVIYYVHMICFWYVSQKTNEPAIMQSLNTFSQLSLFLTACIPLTTNVGNINLRVCFCSSGDHPEDRGHPQGEMCGMFRPSPQPRPIGRGPLAPPRYGCVPREGEIRAEPITRWVQVNHMHASHVLHDTWQENQICAGPFV